MPTWAVSRRCPPTQVFCSRCSAVGGGSRTDGASPADGRASAAVSPCGTYRYTLTRQWDPRGIAVLWIMHNPSTAEGVEDDPTIRRCAGFARAWGYGGITVVNLFALRATDPGVVARHDRPAGPRNRFHLRSAIREHPVCVAAWGAGAARDGRGEAAADWVTRTALELRRRLLCLGTTRDGHPRHPLYVEATRQPTPWTPAAEKLRRPARQETGAGASNCQV